ncbi:ATP-binding protein [Lentzea jiangxiensis]|uniref:Anti-sigma regulatory factor (Ser/Thr protein kinase) n=1 Tax=Lentzea jiangxiensis TaxID=641025 RepID=A0A1H0X6E4_9PSEU|nr:ATP-binding protein [Lentzea jiangxiensis]SDP98490.1 hypothetical protein SAMN05421507_14014 [Lentzea jiangxiensis]
MREKPRFIDSLELVALPTAVAVARMFISDTLKRWQALFIEDYVAAVAVELVTLSVEQTGGAKVPSLIILRMLGYRRHIVFEVTDLHDEALQLSAEADVPEGRGLGLVDAFADRWGSFISPRGRVNWAELAVYGRTAAGLPLRDPQPIPELSNVPDKPALTGDLDLIRRILDGLNKL